MMTTGRPTRYGLEFPPRREELPTPFDFHVHSCFSDASPHRTPFQVCMEARNAGIGHISFTDHDYMMPEEERKSLSDFFSIDVVAGCEVSMFWKVPVPNGRKVLIHVNRHWGTADDPAVRKVLEHNQNQDFEGNAKAMLELLLHKEGIDPSGQGVDASWRMILKNNPLSVHPAKRAVGDLVAAAGYADDRREATDRWLRKGCSCYVPPTAYFNYADFEEAMPAIAAHSVCTLNHIYAYDLNEEELHLLLRDFKALGGSALEVMYPRYDRSRQRQLFRFCHQYGLLPSAGSDTHDDDREFMRGDPMMFRRLRNLQRELHGPIQGGWDICT